jgi:ABC-2 type transport system permease protein
MSAVGGSMFPRFLMTETMEMGLVTFNAWALGGLSRCFWREAPIRHLCPRFGVGGLCGVFLTGASRRGAGKTYKPATCV